MKEGFLPQTSVDIIANFFSFHESRAIRKGPSYLSSLGHSNSSLVLGKQALSNYSYCELLESLTHGSRMMEDELVRGFSNLMQRFIHFFLTSNTFPVSIR